MSISKNIVSWWLNFNYYQNIRWNISPVGTDPCTTLCCWKVVPCSCLLEACVVAPIGLLTCDAWTREPEYYTFHTRCSLCPSAWYYESVDDRWQDAASNVEGRMGLGQISNLDNISITNQDCWWVRFIPSVALFILPHQPNAYVNNLNLNHLYCGKHQLWSHASQKLHTIVSALVFVVPCLLAASPRWHTPISLKLHLVLGWHQLLWEILSFCCALSKSYQPNAAATKLNSLSV